MGNTEKVKTNQKLLQYCIDKAVKRHSIINTRFQNNAASAKNKPFNDKTKQAKEPKE